MTATKTEQATMVTGQPVLEVSNLDVTFETPRGEFTAVDNVSFSLMPGQILGIVGESGSGKSVTCRAILRMIRTPGRITAGTIRVNGEDVLAKSPKLMREFRGRQAAMIFQDPQASLNPVMTIGAQIREALIVHGADGKRAQERTLELLELVGIPDPATAATRYPHQYSGGMRQRVVIAIALANDPSILIADEPTTALDVTIQAQILDLIRELRDKLGIAILFVTHDMGVVSELCDDVVVMNKGQIVERGSVHEVLRSPQDSYTVALMKAVPRLDAPVRPAVPVSGRAASLVVRNLRTDVNAGSGSLFRRPSPFYAVDGVSLEVRSGETLGLVGESGCGKSTLSRTVIGVVPPSSGTIQVNGRDVTAFSKSDRRFVARTVQYVFQDPFSSLNPRRTVGQSLTEALDVAGVPKRDVPARCAELLRRVGLLEEHADRYPYAFSGGQRQRIGVARALAANPEILILDEPVSALDVSIQAQVLELLQELQDDLGLGYLFISHDLAVVRQVSHRVAVMYRGQIVEQGTTAAIFDQPQHEYTQTLFDSTPRIDFGGDPRHATNQEGNHD